MTARGCIWLCLVAAVAVGQEKPLPESGRSVSVGQQQTALPSFDLPEFVITGRESIDLPAAEKQNVHDDASAGVIIRPSTGVVGRTADAQGGKAIRNATNSVEAVNLGRMYLGLGSFSTFLAGVQASGTLGTVHTQGSAEYTSTAGFDPNTDADQFRLDAGIMTPTRLFSGTVLGERVSADAGYERRSYRWYGSPAPDVTRIVTAGSGSAGISGFLAGGSRASFSMGIRGGSVRDSSASVAETLFDADAEYEHVLAGMPVTFHLGLRTAGKDGGTAGSYGGFSAGAATRWSPLELLSTRIGVDLARVYGEAGQSQIVFLPSFSAEFRIDRSHRFVGTYEPRVDFRDMNSMVSDIPFLSASVPVRHTIVRNRGSIGILSDWNSWLRSALELETSRATDAPAVADTGGGGSFTVQYGEVRETLLRGSVVAKLPPNHYFSAIAIIRSSKYSTSGLAVPYLPVSEVRLGYRNEVTEELELDGSVQFVGARESRLSGGSKQLSAYLRADLRATYAITPALKAWAAVRNLLDSRIEHWSGYKEAPFGLHIGVSYAI